MAVDFPPGLEEDDVNLSEDIGGDTPAPTPPFYNLADTPDVFFAPPLQFQPPQDFSGYSPEQLSALRFQQQRELGTMGEAPESQTVASAMMEPFVKLPRYEGMPGMFPGEQSDTAEALGGIYNTLAGFTEGFTSPAAILTMGLGGAARPLANRLLAAGWAGEMGRGIPEQAVDVYEAYKLGLPLREKIQRPLGLLGSAVLTGTTAKEAIHPDLILPERPRVELPESQRALAELPVREGGDLRAQEERSQAQRDVLTQTGEAPNLPTTPEEYAIQQKADEAVRGVPEQPREDAGRVPGQEVPRESAPGAVPPGDEGGAPRAEEARQPEVPLTGQPGPEQLSRIQDLERKVHNEFYKRGSESPDEDLLSITEGRHVSPHQYEAGLRKMLDQLSKGASPELLREGYQKALPEVAEERFQREEGEAPSKPEIARQSASTSKNTLGDPLGSTYHGTPEDFAAYQKVQADIAEAMKAGDMDGAMKLWKENERIKNKYGGMPPEPPKAPEPSKVTEASPFEHKDYVTTDASGGAVLDLEKFSKALDEGKVKGGEAANQLLSHLLKPDENHPLKGIKILDLTPQELAALSGKVAYKGRFILDRGDRAATIEILTRDAQGNPISHQQLVQTLNHELTHNAVDSKYDSAPEHIKQAWREAYEQAKNSAKGTDLESHNAFSNDREFLAEASSSPRIQSFLASQLKEGAKGPLTLKNSKWGQVLDTMRRILKLPEFLKAKGKSVDTITLLDETMRLSGELEQVRREAKTAGREALSPAEGKWTSATDEERPKRTLPMAPRAGEAGAINLSGVAPAVRAAADVIKETGKEALTARPMTDQRKAVLNWSGKLQRSFGEAAAAQKDIAKKVPDPVRREAITNWIQAGGDKGLLAQRAGLTKDAKLKEGYRAALNLTPEELAVANEVKQVYDTLGQRGQSNDVLNSFKDNYVTQIWDLGKGVLGSLLPSSRRLQERFKFSKASSFPTFFDGEQAGFKPKTKDISKLLPVYMHEMNSVIAARQMVGELVKGKASDGRPLVVPRGTGIPVEGAKGEATLVFPDVPKEETADYKVLPEQPALHAWKWATKDTAGNPVFLKGDLALHPEAYKQLKNVLGKSAIREWYQTPTTRTAAIPKLLVRGLDAANSETKRTMLGLLAPFHQVQEATHAIGHRVSPFGNIPKVDLVNNPGQMDAARHGLMLLPDRASANNFMEGFRTSGLVSKIPVLGKMADAYSDYLFHQYIPGLKFKTYEAILKRNLGVYRSELAARKVSPADIKALSAEQANAAYGHINYADLARNPTIQHIMQLGLLAPDFLEARARFTGQAIKGATGAKVGREQLLALGTLALAQAATAYTAANLSGGQWDAKDPFSFTVGSRRYTMRSVPEDIASLLLHTRTFVHSRLSPLIGKGALQYLSGVDYAGRKVSAGETTKELLTQPIPLTLRSLPGVREISGADRPGAIDAWQQLAGAVGLKIARANPNQEINDLHAKWLKENKDPKVKEDYERNQGATFPVSRYRNLDAALSDRDPAKILQSIQELRKTVKDEDIVKRMLPVAGVDQDRPKPLFQGSAELEGKFLRTLSPEERQLYNKARADRMAQWRLFLEVWRKRGPRDTTGQ